MARKDKKQASQPAWAHRVSGRNTHADFPAPDLSSLTMPGNPPGLLARASLDSGITIEIPEWSQLPEGDDELEFVRLQIARSDSAEWKQVGEAIYTHGTSTFPLYITLPADFLLDASNEGPFAIRYEHENWTQTIVRSSSVPIVIDKIPPNFPNAPGPMTFDFGIGPIYDTTLDGLTEIEGTIPTWTGAAEGDQIAFTWVVDKLPDDPNDIVPIDVVPGTDGKVRIPVDVIKALPDGRYCGGYTIWDKAGNRSAVSLYDLIPVALGDLPVTPLATPTVPEASDGTINRADAIAGVHVEFPHITNGKETDEIEITWGTKPLGYRTSVGPNPATFSLPVPAVRMKQEYGASTGEVMTDVLYTVYRGSVAFASGKTEVPVDFSMTGPTNPDWPNPVNPTLLFPDVYGKSGVKNELVDTDENEPINARITLVAPLADGDAYQVLWNGRPIGAPYVIDTTNDSVGDTIEIPLDWDVIRAEGNSPVMPVHFNLSNPGFPHNDQESGRSKVKIEFLTITLPIAEPQKVVGTVTKRLACNSLFFEDGKVGFKYLIPPSDYLREGMTVDVEWKAYTTYNSPVEVPAAGKKMTLGPISKQEETNGVLWLIEPFDTHLLPTWGGRNNQTGKGEVIYTLVVGGDPVSSLPSDTQVVVSAGTGTCDLTPTP
ncbi:hypothetical protein NTD86_15980 [Pseudomonas sp. 7P_10.2_Bac1]|uniref:hypothetical protein n=1 Tax=Pseudomonas sp. 7P_10.2_Bac1 TaxID=2971614 RepID=UPI0021C69CC2|nr:hypothetical protein [Pseudomonas sp. 7P_10.2_Bac1]MCU1728485.1 hypothetical protein [Pseudomonas sp. 7P_10.2_Bac1]